LVTLVSKVAFIFARGGSKGLPGKNIKLIAGKPLIAWSIEHAKQTRGVERVIVSTDSIEIAKVAEKFGADVPFMRPPELASDSAPEWLAWQHAIKYLEKSTGKIPEIFISVPPTSPLRLVSDIERCIEVYENDGADVVITVSETDRSPYFNMVKSNSDGSFALAVDSEVRLIRRQDAPRLFNISTACYVADPKFVLNHNSIFEGRVNAVEIPTDRAIDIDTLLDFRIATMLMTSRGTTNG